MVKCADCGFLSFRHTKTGELVEVTEEVREFGQVKVMEFGEYALDWEDLPLCVMQAYDLRQESFRLLGPMSEEESKSIIAMSDVLRDRMVEEANEESRRNTFHKDRDCPSYIKWHQGFTPKEHREMLDRTEWRNWQEEQRRKDKRWRLIELLAFIITGAVVAIVAALIERGTIP